MLIGLFSYMRIGQGYESIKIPRITSNLVSHSLIFPFGFASQRISMEFIAFISYMTCKTTVGTNRSFFLGMPSSFATIMIQKSTFVLINKHSNSCFKIVSNVAMTNIPPFLFLQNQGAYIAQSGKWLNQQDLTNEIAITIIQTHQEMKNMFLILSIQLRSFGSTSTSTRTNNKRLIIGKLIPQCFEFDEVRTN